MVISKARITLGVLVVLLVIREGVEQFNNLPNYRVGDVVKVMVEQEEIRGARVVTKQGLVIELPPTLRMKSGEKGEIVGRVVKRVIDGNKSEKRLEIQGFSVIPASKVPNYPRDKAINTWLRWLPGDEGALMAGILWGGEEGMSLKMQENFKKTGIAHIVAASGYNVAVVANWLMVVLIPVLGRRKAILFAIVCTLLYMFLAGWTIPVIRAGIMLILVLAAQASGRPAAGKRALILSVLLMLIWRPEWATEISFQLSVAATVGILWGEEVLPKLPLGMTTTLVAWAVTMPLILHYFGRMSWLAPVVNAAVVEMVPIVMQLGLIVTGIGLVWQEAGRLLALGVWPGLRWITGVAELVGSWRGGESEVGQIGWGWVLCYYLALVCGYKYVKKKKQLALKKLARSRSHGVASRVAAAG